MDSESDSDLSDLSDLPDIDLSICQKMRGVKSMRLEDTIRSEFLPFITGHPPPNDSMRKLLALPARLGGLGIPDASSRSEDEFNASIKITTPLINLRGSEPTWLCGPDNCQTRDPA